MENMPLEDFVKHLKNITDDTIVTLNGEELFVFSKNEDFILEFIAPKDSQNGSKCTGE